MLVGENIGYRPLNCKSFTSNIVNALICNRTLNQLTKVFPSKYMCRVILPYVHYNTLAGYILAYNYATMIFFKDMSRTMCENILSFCSICMGIGIGSY